MNDLLITITGTVISGDRVGRTIGFPTANVATVDMPEDLQTGVYKSLVTLATGEVFTGLAYYGPRLIFGEKVNSFEVFLLEFSGDLYEQKIRVQLEKYLRPPRDVSSLEELKQLLQSDLLTLQSA